MVELEFSDNGTVERAKKTFANIAKRVKDLTPVWNQYAGYHTAQLVPQTFATRGAAMSDGQRWKGYSQAYKKRKKQLGGLLGNMLVLSGDLLATASGGAGYKKQVNKRGMIMTISGLPYIRVHQSGYGSIPARPYFYKGSYNSPDLPRRAWAYLVRATENHIMKGVK